MTVNRSPLPLRDPCPGLHRQESQRQQAHHEPSCVRGDHLPSPSFRHNWPVWQVYHIRTNVGLASKVPVNWGSRLRLDLGAYRKELDRNRTSRPECPNLGPLQTCREGGSDGKSYHRQFLNDPDRREYFVPVRWLQTVDIKNAINEIGLFGNQNTVCKPTTPKWRYTVDRLKKSFPDFDS